MHARKLSLNESLREGGRGIAGLAGSSGYVACW